MTADINRSFALQIIKSNPHTKAVFDEMVSALESAQEYIRLRQPEWAKAEDLPPVMHEISNALLLKGSQ